MRLRLSLTRAASDGRGRRSRCLLLSLATPVAPAGGMPGIVYCVGYSLKVSAYGARWQPTMKPAEPVPELHAAQRAFLERHMNGDSVRPKEIR